MTLANLDNLVKIGKLKNEAPDQNEFDGMVGSAKLRLQDSKINSLSDDSKFSLALAAMRWHGYRSDNRYLWYWGRTELSHCNYYY